MAKIKKNEKRRKSIGLVKCVWGIICSLSSTDQRTNNISLFNIIDEISLPTDFFQQQEEQKKQKKILLAPLPHEVILFWRRLLNIEFSNEEMIADLKVKTINPQGSILQETITTAVRFEKDKRNLRIGITMPGLIADMAGDYMYRVEIKLQDDEDFKFALEIPFIIKKLL